MLNETRKLIMNNEISISIPEVAVDNFDVLSKHSHGGAEENCETG
jgi:hypothetical protein